ncbi:YtcA family lipoprotein [Candidatus Binatia bacterium]|nr:YtcA family lipoprotein [Candidatus Binatia bacterium]
MVGSTPAPTGAPQSKSPPPARRVAIAHTAAAALLLPVGSCDPVINVYGSFFPAWIVCLLFGIVLTVVARLALAIVGLERHMAPLLLVYPSLTVLFTCLTWLLLFRT